VKIDLYDEELEVSLDEDGEVLDIMNFTAYYGDKIYEDLEKYIKRKPTQHEYNANIDISYEEYLVLFREEE